MAYTVTYSVIMTTKHLRLCFYFLQQIPLHVAGGSGSKKKVNTHASLGKFILLMRISCELGSASLAAFTCCTGCLAQPKKENIPASTNDCRVRHIYFCLFKNRLKPTNRLLPILLVHTPFSILPRVHNHPLQRIHATSDSTILTPGMEECFEEKGYIPSNKSQ